MKKELLSAADGVKCIHGAEPGVGVVGRWLKASTICVHAHHMQELLDHFCTKSADRLAGWVWQ